MAMKNQPCAYCGLKDSPRTRGHVLPRSMYPDSLPNAKRITVPECDVCKAIWEDAEPHFKNIILAIWNSDQLPEDNRVEKMWRGFRQKDGRRRAREFHELIRPAQIADKDRELIYPAKDARFNLILRRIVRGLAVEHKVVKAAVSDNRVHCDVMRWPIPPAFEADLTWRIIADDFFQYAYADLDNESLQSFWLLQFSKHLLFFGVIANEPKEA